ncbi:MAG TPA: RDD family protein [Gaiellaceae bacterium]|nr:RDD family protein [Gaiellaceae bacterium]
MATAATPIQPGLSAVRVPYAGIATRAVALAIDLAIVHVVVLVGAGLLGLVASLVGELRPDWLVAILAGVAWALSVTVYFVLFWSVTGQTPGLRAMRLRVAAGTGSPSLGRALLRLVGLVLAIVPLFAGFLPVLFDQRRRGLHDYLAGTVVLYTDRAQPLVGEAER